MTPGSAVRADCTSPWIFVAQSVLGLKLPVIYRGIVPFLVLYLGALVLITYVPEISLAGVRLFLAH